MTKVVTADFMYLQNRLQSDAWVQVDGNCSYFIIILHNNITCCDIKLLHQLFHNSADTIYSAQINQQSHDRLP